MDKKPSGLRARWKTMYHRSSIQLILSIAFTAVAVIGMLFLGMALLLRFSSSANEMAAESSQRVLEQVNWNLDSYLRSMMRVSDTVYYRVIKNADLEQSGTEQELRDALELLYAKDRDVLVSLALFDSDGGLISSTVLTLIFVPVVLTYLDGFVRRTRRFLPRSADDPTLGHAPAE